MALSNLLSNMSDNSTEDTPLDFPPLTKSHILHCSYHSWYPKYRSLTPKARIIPLSDAFLKYLRSDGIILPPEDYPTTSADDDWTVSGGYDDSEEEEDEDPSKEWPEIHARIKAVIAELGGSVSPKLNWSAPKDATWINVSNSMQCKTPNDVYLLLKSSNFVAHDLEHAFDDCVIEDSNSTGSEHSSAELTTNDIPYHLVLRKYVNVNPSVEFRCFVRNRRLLGICQRDTTHFAFLPEIQNEIRHEIQDFFDAHLCDTFPDPSFVFDVYIPAPHNRVWLIDINPWALRTDPILFSWSDILSLEGPSNDDSRYIPDGLSVLPPKERVVNGHSEEEEGEDVEFVPWFMLVGSEGPSDVGLRAPQYSAHKMPKDVVDASMCGIGGMSEFLGHWNEILEKQVQQDEELESEEG